MVTSISNRRTFNLKALASFLFSLIFLAGIVWLLVWLGVRVFGMFSGLNPTLGVSLITASTTVIVSTFTVMAGRYFERKKEREALYRDRKTVIYEEFLVVLFRLLQESKQEDSKQEANPDMVKFLREHHRKLILWTGSKGVKAYSDWYRLLQERATSAQAILKMEHFFLALREDLGHSNRGLNEGDILRLILNDTDFLLQAAKVKPDVTLDEIVALQKDLANSRNPPQ